MSCRIHVGGALEVLATLPTESVHCVITSPPYWGLRGYTGDPGMIGLEPTFGEHVKNLVRVFREIRRVLRPDGTVWLNYGDAYANSGTGGNGATGGADKSTLASPMPPPNTTPTRKTIPHGLKPKDLMMMPARVAIALQEDGWWLRSDIIWKKPNPMPESATDRPCSAHEHIFLLAKAPRYFYDAVAVSTPLKESSARRLAQPTLLDQEGGPKDPKTGNRSHRKVIENLHKRHFPSGWAQSKNYRSQDPRYADRDPETITEGRPEALTGANMRNVQTFASAQYKGAHFATYPPDLVQMCVKAGTSERGVCPVCLAPWLRQSTADYRQRDDMLDVRRYGDNDNELDASSRWHGYPDLRKTTATVGWEPSCKCGADPVPATVLDPFAGAGTTGLVAERLGRDSLLIEISQEYAELAADRILADAPMFTDVDLVGVPSQQTETQHD